jgi:Tfp pilus assembly protein PilO
MNLAAVRNLPKEKKQQMALIGIVTLAAVIGLVQFYVLNQWNRRAAARDRVAQLTDQIAEAEKKARQAAANEEFREQVRAFVAAQQTGMIRGDPFAWVVREITLLAEAHPIQVVGLRPGAKGEPADRPKYPTYLTRLEITGDYDQLGAFVRDLENRFPTAEIRSLAVTGQEQGRHQAVIDLRLLIQPEPTAKKSEANAS